MKLVLMFVATFAIGLVGTFGVIFILAEDPVSRSDLTRTAIGESLYRIHLYAKANGKLPDVVAEFPRRGGYANRTTDGWGNELVYEVSDSRMVTLTSLGADNKLGGVGDDSDVSISCRSVGTDGGFIADDEDWIYDCRSWTQYDT